MPTAETVVVGVDGSEPALRAVRWAAARVARRAGRLRLVYAVDDPLLSYDRDPPMRERGEANLRAHGDRVLREAERAAAEMLASGGGEVESVERPGAAVRVLLDESRHADLLVLGTWGLTAVGRALVGSTTIALAARAACPTAVVRGRTENSAPPSDGPVVVGVEEMVRGQARDRFALAAAFEAASACGAALIVVHVRRHTRLAGGESKGQAVAADERHAQRLAKWQQRYPDVEVERLASHGHPADVLAGLGEHARLLVVGSRGCGGLTGMLLGSTSQAVLLHAPCPVLVARPLTRERKDGQA